VCESTGYAPRELLAMRVHDLLDVAGRIFYETHFAPLLRMQGFFHEVALDLVARDRTRLPVLVNAAERRDAAGAHLFTRLTIFNATDRRRYERELLEARRVAEDAQRRLEEANVALNANLRKEQATAALREQFIAVLGHDLRNPLSAIASSAELIARAQPDGVVARAASTIQGSVVRMAGLIDNLMDFARGRLGGGITLERSRGTALEPVLRHVVEEMRVAHPDRVILADVALHEPLDGDARRLAQLFSNLLANALTHGAPGEPVRAWIRAADGVFELSVANAGAPIAPAVMARLFEPFYRGEVRASRHGLGLGLYIAAQIAQAHGGALSVESTLAETRFTFRMPNPQAAG